MELIKSLIIDLFPGQYNSRNELSVACVSTSNPVYLVFNRAEQYPAYVVRISKSEEIRTTHQITEKIYEFVGDLSPQPLNLSKSGKKYISVQKGLKGNPWFQITKKYSTTTQWNALKDRAVGTLNQFHNGINTSSYWGKPCKPGHELRQCYRQCIDSGTKLPSGISEQIDILSSQLDKLGTINTYPQHGDFSINNLIIEDDKIHIIDFEDFGMTYMPLHDQFTLALSHFQLSPKFAKTSLGNEVNLCVIGHLELNRFSEKHLSGFFLHHLLFRLGAWSQNRLPYREWLLTILDKFIESPNYLKK
jgi:hypothetical protein